MVSGVLLSNTGVASPSWFAAAGIRTAEGGPTDGLRCQGRSLLILYFFLQICFLKIILL
jgi:hypothetical protein